MPDPLFWRGRRVLLTGHTGFKGSWASFWLTKLGARVTGLALSPETQPSLYALSEGALSLESRIGDIRSLTTVQEAVRSADPEVVLHMAAQPLVRRSYRDPIETFTTNVIGTVHLLDSLREALALSVVLVVTSDKAYENNEGSLSLGENDRLGGADPYSASKACTEIVAASYARSFFEPRDVRVATARAGNVIGGGDWSDDRLIPDLWRSAVDGKPVLLRYPNATRPWQHVLEPLAGYFEYIEQLAKDGDNKLPRALNFGPSEASKITVAEIAESFYAARGNGCGWLLDSGPHPPEKKALIISSELARGTLGWRPMLSSAERIEWTAQWYRAYEEGASVSDITIEQIARYEARLA